MNLSSNIFTNSLLAFGENVAKHVNKLPIANGNKIAKKLRILAQNCQKTVKIPCFRAKYYKATKNSYFIEEIFATQICQIGWKLEHPL